MDQLAPDPLSVADPLRTWVEGLDLRNGQHVLLTADVTRLAWTYRRLGVRQVPRLLLDAVLERIGPGGTLVVPSFDHDLRSGARYDPLHTPPITGDLSVAALGHAAFARTRHPLHSFAVAGKLQPLFLAVDDPSSFSERSAFALFREHSFTVIGIDLDLDFAFSYFHHVEELEHVRYRKWRPYVIRYVSDGVETSRSYTLYAKRWGYANRLWPLRALLEQAGALRTARVSGSQVLWVDVRSSHPVIEQDIRTNGAHSIVHFTFRNWLRDAWHAIKRLRPALRRPSPTRTDHARPA